MNSLPGFPAAVHDYIRFVFGEVNRRICEKIARVPNTSEPSLDMTFIELLSHYSAPHLVAPGWAVRIDVHFLGGLRHWMTWEIADIGVLVFAKRGAEIAAKKVALLQSKRLYPDNSTIIEESHTDYMIGFGHLLPGDPPLRSIALKHDFIFTAASRYNALAVSDQQYKSISDFEKGLKLPVYYLLYNPWAVPATYSYPVMGPITLEQVGNGGCRVMPSSKLRAAMAKKAKGYRPTFGDLVKSVGETPEHTHGWRLEYFMADLVMKCREGELFESLNQENMFVLFNRRSGPISAAIAVTVEQVDWND